MTAQMAVQLITAMDQKHIHITTAWQINQSLSKMAKNVTYVCIC